LNASVAPADDLLKDRFAAAQRRARRARPWPGRPPGAHHSIKAKGQLTPAWWNGRRITDDQRASLSTLLP